ncbi:MFS transporter [Arthrobacter caoxuetaonis]|uniref:MFS transporter n=1 Tax=Arthrobacter caoxuetaonis TaxID=2886935 RepID=A0A9X1SCB9_9MICC|nr:MFS transporter [Arthrobacter caoxuetaonis]MCC3298465.1 MFS transporter [Arthrobacter caoxuetaonis]USQ57523.1 MFS transporter [Arthrobacter caoxuetaonis]
MGNFGGRKGPFRYPNFSWYFTGQVLSNTGVWFQNLALQLVVLGATGSAQALSGITIAQFLPIFLLGIPAGRLLDRVAPRTVLLVTSLASAVVTASLVLTRDPDLWLLYGMVGVLGSVQAFERVAAQTIIFELVGPDGLSKAASISTISLAAARSVGPALAGLAFQGLGPSACILINAAAYLLVFASRLRIRPDELHRRSSQAQQRPRDKAVGAAASGTFRRSRDVNTLLIMNVVISLLAMNFGLVLTSTVNLSYGGDAGAVGAVHTLNAVGAVLGGILAARRPRVSVRSMIAATSVFGAALALNAAAPTLLLFLAVAPVLGIAVGYYQGIVNAAAQESVRPQFIGRMMSLMTMGSYGMVPFGALLMGWVIDASSGRVALAVSAVSAFACLLVVLIRTRPVSR